VNLLPYSDVLNMNIITDFRRFGLQRQLVTLFITEFVLHVRSEVFLTHVITSRVST
jgi:hypothetical protein